MYMEFPQFRHIHWIVTRPPPRYDLAWSNIRPEWPGVLGKADDPSLISASDPEGVPELRRYLSGMYGLDPSRIVLTNGTSEANFLAFMSLLEKGDRVLVEKPIYTPLLEIPRSMGCEVHTIKRRPDDFRFDLAELREKIETIQPALFVMQNMNNPTGRALFEYDLRDIARVLEDHDLPVLVDEVYRDYAMFVEDGRLVNAFPSMVEIYDRAVITSSLTKVYGAGGLMTGWMAAPRRIAKRARRIKNYFTPIVNHMGNRIAHAILGMRDRIMPAELTSVREKLNLISTWAKGRSDVHWSEPDGCSIGFLRYDRNIPSIDLCRRLYDEHDVRVVPGEFFHIERGFRLGVAGNYDDLRSGLEEIDRLLDSL